MSAIMEETIPPKPTLNKNATLLKKQKKPPRKTGGIVCSSCKQEYNSQYKIPYIISCGHSLCSQCLEYLFRDANRRCCDCNVLFTNSSLDDCIPNKDLLELKNRLATRDYHLPEYCRSYKTILDKMEDAIIEVIPALDNLINILDANNIAYIKRVKKFRAWLDIKRNLQNLKHNINCTADIRKNLAKFSSMVSEMEFLVPNIKYVHNALVLDTGEQSPYGEFSFEAMVGYLKNNRLVYTWYRNGRRNFYGKVTLGELSVLIHHLEDTTPPLACVLYELRDVLTIVPDKDKIVFFDIMGDEEVKNLDKSGDFSGIYNAAFVPDEIPAGVSNQGNITHLEVLTGSGLGLESSTTDSEIMASTDKVGSIQSSTNTDVISETLNVEILSSESSNSEVKTFELSKVSPETSDNSLSTETSSLEPSSIVSTDTLISISSGETFGSISSEAVDITGVPEASNVTIRSLEGPNVDAETSGASNAAAETMGATSVAAKTSIETSVTPDFTSALRSPTKRSSLNVVKWSDLENTATSEDLDANSSEEEYTPSSPYRGNVERPSEKEDFYGETRIMVRLLNHRLADRFLSTCTGETGTSFKDSVLICYEGKIYLHNVYNVNEQSVENELPEMAYPLRACFKKDKIFAGLLKDEDTSSFQCTVSCFCTKEKRGYPIGKLIKGKRTLEKMCHNHLITNCGLLVKIPEFFPENVTENVDENVTENVDENVTENVVEMVTEIVNEMVTKIVEGKVTENVDGKVTENDNENVTENDNVTKNLPEN